MVKRYKKKTLILLFSIGVIAIFALLFQKISENEIIQQIYLNVSRFNPYFVNDCELIMKQQNLTYALCTLVNETVVLYEKNMNCSVQFEKVEKCNFSDFITTFKPGQYLRLHVNLQKLPISFEKYYVCYYSDFPIYETVYPKNMEQPNLVFTIIFLGVACFLETNIIM